jgi:Icc-related predicted phosphoesterase
MLLVADVHGAFDDLARVIATGEPVVILGDLINFVDYRTGEGIAAEVFGVEFAQAAARYRRNGDFAASRRLWRERSAGREEEVRARVGGAIAAQYAAMRSALAGGSGFITHGNVDVPSLLQSHLPDGFRYVNGEVVELEGVRMGIVGGGSKTGLNAAGEISEEEMARLLEDMGPVDVLGTHVPPSIDPLRFDVITGRLEGGSEAVAEYLHRHQPLVHYFGDIHQPQASRWRVGRTRCVNVGYFRATARAVRHA